MTPFRIIIAGGRDFTDAELMQTKCDPIMSDLVQKGYTLEIVSGKARGADQFGELYAQSRNIPVKQFPADWKRYGKAAGYRRNAQMADYANELEYGGLIAFWDGKSRGTKAMIDLATKKGLMVEVINY